MQARGEAAAEERLLDLLAPMPRFGRRNSGMNPMEMLFGGGNMQQEDTAAVSNVEQEEARSRRDKVRQLLAQGQLEDH